MNNFNENWIKTVHSATQNPPSEKDTVNSNANLKIRQKFNSLWQNSDEQSDQNFNKTNQSSNDIFTTKVNKNQFTTTSNGSSSKDNQNEDFDLEQMQRKEKEEEVFNQKIELAKKIAFEEGIKHGIEIAKKELLEQQHKQDEKITQIIHQLNSQLNTLEQKHMAYWTAEATSFAITLFEKIFQEKVHEPRFWLSTLNNMIEKFPTPKPFLYVYASDDLYQMLKDHSDEIKEKIQIQKKHSLPEMTIEVESNQSGYSFCAKEILTAVLEKIHVNKNEDQ